MAMGPAPEGGKVALDQPIRAPSCITLPDQEQKRSWSYSMTTGRRRGSVFRRLNVVSAICPSWRDQSPHGVRPGPHIPDLPLDLSDSNKICIKLYLTSRIFLFGYSVSSCVGAILGRARPSTHAPARSRDGWITRL